MTTKEKRWLWLFIALFAVIAVGVTSSANSPDDSPVFPGFGSVPIDRSICLDPLWADSVGCQP
jgi:hypothetical protein